MPILTIQLPKRSFEKAKTRARKEGFRSPAEWARVLVSRYVDLEESPKLKPTQIVRAMRRTGLYKYGFLRELERSLKYADKTAQ